MCREPLSFYFGREFRDYLQQEWIEHLLRYGERPGGYPAWPDLVLLGRNPYLPYVVLRYAARLQSMKWYLTEREYREEEEWLTGELEDEYGLIPEIRLLAETADYGTSTVAGDETLRGTGFCDNEKGLRRRTGSRQYLAGFSGIGGQGAPGHVVQCPQIRYFSMKKSGKTLEKPRNTLTPSVKMGIITRLI